MKPLVAVIANPAASGFRGDEFRQVVRILSDNFEVEPHWPESPAENRELSKELASREAHTVIAMGGDGVVHHASQGIIGTDTALGIISAGTTNVLSRMLGLPQRPKSAATHLRSAEAIAVPTIRASITQPSGDVIQRQGLFAVGAGFDAAVVGIAERDPWRKKAFGAGHYLASTLQALRAYRKAQPAITVSAEDFDFMGVSVLCQVHDPYTYFGRFPLSLGDAPQGAFHLGMIKKLPARSIPQIAFKAFRSKFGEAKQVEVAHNVQSAHFTFNEPTPIQADGEPICSAVETKIEFSLDDLKVLI